MASGTLSLLPSVAQEKASSPDPAAPAGPAAPAAPSAPAAPVSPPTSTRDTFPTVDAHCSGLDLSLELNGHIVPEVKIEHRANGGGAIEEPVVDGSRVTVSARRIRRDGRGVFDFGKPGMPLDTSVVIARSGLRERHIRTCPVTTGSRDTNHLEAGGADIRLDAEPADIDGLGNREHVCVGRCGRARRRQCAFERSLASRPAGPAAERRGRLMVASASLRVGIGRPRDCP